MIHLTETKIHFNQRCTKTLEVLMIVSNSHFLTIYWLFSKTVSNAALALHVMNSTYYLKIEILVFDRCFELILRWSISPVYFTWASLKIILCSDMLQTVNIICILLWLQHGHGSYKCLQVVRNGFVINLAIKIQSKRIQPNVAAASTVNCYRWINGDCTIILAVSLFLPSKLLESFYFINLNGIWYSKLKYFLNKWIPLS